MSNQIDIKQFARDLILKMGMPIPNARNIVRELCSTNGYNEADAMKVLDEMANKINITEMKLSTNTENISRRVKDYIYQTEGRYFDLSDLDNELGFRNSEQKQSRKQAIYRFKADGLIEAHPRIEGKYRYINRDAEILDWVSADPNNFLNVNWPHGDDNTSFEALEGVKIFPGSVIVIAGVSNMGKTTFCLGMMLANMDNYHCVYMTNELGKEEFKSRMVNYEFVELYKPGTKIPKFETIVRYDNYQDVIRPGWFNFLDYVDPGENPYLIGQMIDQFKQKVGDGIIVVAIQKGEKVINTAKGAIRQTAVYGTGGQYSEHRARLVIHIDMGVLWIKKAKAWKPKTVNPNNKRYSFEIVDFGSSFHNIQEITEQAVSDGEKKE